MKLSNLNLNSPKIRQGMNRLWMVLTGMTSIIVSIVVGTQDSDNWFAALLITGLVMYLTGLALYWLAHWIIQGFRIPPVPPKPTPNPPPPSPPHSQSHQSKRDKTRIGRLTFLKYFLLNYFGLTIAATIVSVFIARHAPADEFGHAILALWILTAILQFCFIINHTIRRLHDMDRSGGWGWLLLIPLVNLIFFVVLCCVRGSPGENRYGMPESKHIISQTGSKQAGATPPPPKDNKLRWIFISGWNFIWDGRRGFLLWLMAVVAVIVIAASIYILIREKNESVPNKSVRVQATPYAAVCIKPPQSDNYTPPERPDERYTPVTLKVPAGTDIMLKYKEYKIEFPYEEWKDDREIWYDFLEK